MGPDRVRSVGAVRIGLARLEIGLGREMEDQVRLERHDRRAHGPTIADVESAHLDAIDCTRDEVAGRDLVAGGKERRDHRTAEHPGGAGNQDSHITSLDLGVLIVAGNGGGRGGAILVG